MKQLIVLISAVLISTCSFAELNKNSTQLNALGSAWKAKSNTQALLNENKNDIAIVYGGEDISRRPTLAFRTATA